ncbi:MAG: InlB B-repeat-containing protein [Dysgonamonadaceae bacterium]|jgi:uncharacterized repeat protein (TIGR02543 family)|nr:InlB B-repeat-containing protein [Dysgonamonadaceae bacterium]
MRKKILNLIVAMMFLSAVSAVTCAANFSVSASKLTVSNAEGIKKFFLECDRRWNLSATEEWISVSPKNGNGCEGKVTVTVEVEQNSSGTEREADILFSTDGETVNITVSQVNSDEGYWKDGELITLHSHGILPDGLKPVPIMLVGNGWDLSDLKKGGLWEQFAGAWSDLFLQQDIVKPLADWFDVFAYCAESNQRGNIGYTAFKPEIDSHRDMNAMVTDATLPLVRQNYPNIYNIVFIDVSNGSVGGWNMFADNSAIRSGAQLAMYGNPSIEQSGQYWWTHEFVGHDLANMPDYYYHHNKLVNADVDAKAEQVPYTEISWDDSGTKRTFKRTGTYPQCIHEYEADTIHCDAGGVIRSLVSGWDNGYWWNSDWESDTSKVIWKDFIGRKGYDNVGVFVHGNYNGMDKYFRPEDHNVMNENWGDDNIWHEVGARMWIYNRILERAGVPSPHLVSNPDRNNLRSLENFMKFDSDNGYNDNGFHSRTFIIPKILTKRYWLENNLFPDYRRWISGATIEGLDGDLQKLNVIKDGKRLNPGNDFILSSENGNFLTITGVGDYSGSIRVKLKEGAAVTYSGNLNTGGKNPVDLSLYRAGDKVTALFDPLPEKDGYTFIGWAKNTDAVKPDLTPKAKTLIAGQEDITLNAVWKANTYKITFNSNGGSTVKTVTATCGATIKEPAQPNKKDFAFGGWYRDSDYQTAWIFADDEVPAGGTTLYARWLRPSEGTFINLDVINPSENGEGWTYKDSVYYIHNGANVTVTGTTNTASITIDSAATVELKLSDVNIDVRRIHDAVPVNVTGAHVKLILEGKNILRAGRGRAALEQSGSGRLNICGIEAGSLYAYGGRYAAGIGGGAYSGSGEIVISGGIVYGTSDTSRGAGIGGGRDGKGGSLVIDGGTVIAVGVGGSTAIGHGRDGQFDKITINGGSVYADSRTGLAIDNGQASGLITIGKKANVYMRNAGQHFKGQIETGATVREDTGGMGFFRYLGNGNYKIEGTEIVIEQ